MTVGQGGGSTGSIPAGLPDEATLTRMAAEFFGTLGSSSTPAHGAPADTAHTGQVPSGALPPGTVPAEAPSESGVAPVRLDLPGVGGSSTTGPAQYANSPVSSDGFVAPGPPAVPGTAPPAVGPTPGGPATPSAPGLPAPPRLDVPGAGGASTTGPAQYAGTPAGFGEFSPSWLDAGVAPGLGVAAAPHSLSGNPFGDHPVVVPPLPAVPGMKGLAAPSGPAGPASSATPSDSGAAPSALPEVPDFGVRAPELPGVPALDLLAPQRIPGADPNALPHGLPVSAPSTPYYFLGEASGYPSSAGVPLAEVAERPSGGRPEPEPGHGEFDVEAIRRDFPILSETVNGRPLVWFDNAATTQKPQAVIDRLAYFYAHENSNIHRAAHELAARSTDAYEGARDKVARFIGAGSSSECVFVRGATEAINLVAAAWGRRHIRAGDEIVISHLEHHANIVPWQELVKQTGAVLKVIPVDSDGQILLQHYTDLLSDRTKLVAITQVSNALGTVVPVKQVADLAHRAGACVLVDGAQSVPHLRVDVQDLGADFFAFSGHKIFAPTGIGVLYIREDIAEDMAPYQTGGNMIRDVTLERSLFNHAPMKFEAGTGNIADAVGLGAALDYLERIGFENAARYEHGLLEYGMAALREVPGLTLIGTAPDKASVMSFVLDGYTPEQVGTALNREGIAVRSGHHCAQPILRRYGLEATVRPSLAFYNTCGEIDHMVAVLRRLAADGGGAANRSKGTDDPAP